MTSTPPPLKPKVKAKARAEESGPADEGEGHNDSNWIVSYADMMTLLCVFFVLMFSLANPDPAKLEKVRRETAEYLGTPYKSPYEKLTQNIRDVIADQKLQNSVWVESDSSGVTVTFRGTIFFESGKADLQEKSGDLLRKMADIMKKEAAGMRILVEGHTDDVPIESRVFPSNWELSGARASRVIRLFAQLGFEQKLLTAIGYGETRPLSPNRDPAGKPIQENQARNRRVVLRMMK